MAVAEVGNNSGRFVFGFDSERVESDDGLGAFGEGIFGSDRGSGALKDEAVGVASNLGGEAESGVFGVLILRVGWLMGLVDNDAAEIVDRGEQSGTRADDDVWLV